MKEKKLILLSMILMVVSGIMLLGALVYYDFSDQIKKYKYSDLEEYESVKEGLNFIEKLPIHFNIINKYFSNLNNLNQAEKEEIVMAYVIKNKYALYECGPSSNVSQYLCINKEDLNSEKLLNRFGLDLKFSSDKIKIYVDDYGTYLVNSNENKNYYQIVLDNSNNKMYRMYTKFSHYKQKNDIYVFYVYQGYYNGNCDKGSELSLYDFMTGKEIYKDTCNGNQNFTIDPGKNVESLQLYKYELKKDKNDNFYLYGYNPVNKYE